MVLSLARSFSTFEPRSQMPRRRGLLSVGPLSREPELDAPDEDELLVPLVAGAGALVREGIDAAIASMCSFSAAAPEPFASLWYMNWDIVPTKLRRALTRSSSLCSSARRAS